MKRLIDEFILREAYLNKADFLRDAVREKIRRDAPELFDQSKEA